MKTKKTFLLIGIIATLLLTFFSCEKPEDPKPVQIDSIAELLKKYSWYQEKYFIRDEDSSMYDVTENIIGEGCNYIYTFAQDSIFFGEYPCNGDTEQMFWHLRNNSTEIVITIDTNWAEEYPDQILKIEKLTEDTLKIYYVNVFKQEEQFVGSVMYFVAIDKKQY